MLHKVVEYWRTEEDGKRTLCAYIYDDATQTFSRIAEDKLERSGLSIWDVPMEHINMHIASKEVARFAQKKRIEHHREEGFKSIIQ